jgi:hypothetical protein
MLIGLLIIAFVASVYVLVYVLCCIVASMYVLVYALCCIAADADDRLGIR